jgi:hypothetical protein
MESCAVMKEWADKTWFFLDEEANKIIFTVTIEHPANKTPPAELVELIELYSQGYRKKD